MFKRAAQSVKEKATAKYPEGPVATPVKVVEDETADQPKVPVSALLLLQ